MGWWWLGVHFAGLCPGSFHSLHRRAAQAVAWLSARVFEWAEQGVLLFKQAAAWMDGCSMSVLQPQHLLLRLDIKGCCLAAWRPCIRPPYAPSCVYTNASASAVFSNRIQAKVPQPNPAAPKLSVVTCLEVIIALRVIAVLIGLRPLRVALWLLLLRQHVVLVLHVQVLERSLRGHIQAVLVHGYVEPCGPRTSMQPW